MLGLLQADDRSSSWSLRSDVSTSGRRLVDVQVVGVEKRYSPRRHHVYIIAELWSDDSRLVVYRTHRQFRALHKQLKETFPVEAGHFRDEDKVLPKFPHKPSSPGLGRKKSVGRFANVQKDLQEYCRDLLKLDPKIVLTPLFQGFFEPSDDDLRSYQNSGKHEKTVMIIPNEAAVPEELRSPRDLEISAPLFELDSYCAVADYKAASKGELSLKAGDVCDVIHTTPSGWWLVENSGCERGWVPASHLQLISTTDTQLVTSTMDTQPATGPPNTHTSGSPDTHVVPSWDAQSAAGQEGPAQLYVSTRRYTATEEDELSFCAGAVLQVLQKTDDGWWLARYSGQQGFVPAMFLRQYNSPCVQIVAAQDKLSVVNLLAAEKQDQKSRNSMKGSCSDVSRMSLLGDLSLTKSHAGTDVSGAGSTGLPEEGISDMKSLAGKDASWKGHDVETMDSLVKGEYMKASQKLDLPQITITAADFNAACDYHGQSSSSDMPFHRVQSLTDLADHTEANCFQPRRRANSETRLATPSSPRIPPRPSQQEIIQKCSPVTRRRLLATPCTPPSDCSSVEEEPLNPAWADSQRDDALGIINLGYEPCKDVRCYVVSPPCDRYTCESFETDVQSAFCDDTDTSCDMQNHTENSLVEVSTGGDEVATFVRNNRFWRTLKLKR